MLLKNIQTIPVLLKLNLYLHLKNKFNFSAVTTIETYELILNLDKSKNTSGNIPTQILQLATNECSENIKNYSSIENSVFPNELKYADVIPCHKKR